MFASNEGGNSDGACEENIGNGEAIALAKEGKSRQESIDWARATKKTRGRSRQNGSEMLPRKSTSNSTLPRAVPRGGETNKITAVRRGSGPSEHTLGPDNKEVRSPASDNGAASSNKAEPQHSEEVVRLCSDEHESRTRRSHKNEKKVDASDGGVRRPRDVERAALSRKSDAEKESDKSDDENLQSSFLTTAMWEKYEGKTKSGASPTNADKAESSKRRIIDDDFNVGKDVSTDWGTLACAPNYLAKTALNALSIPVLAAGYAVGKMGTWSPILNNGGLANSTAFQYGFKSVLYANGIIPTLLVKDGAGDFRDAPIMVSNHLSYLDGFTLATMLNVPKIIVKSEIKDYPVLGQFMHDIDCLFVDRDSPNSKRMVLDTIKKHADEWQHGDRPLLIFPEGTTSNGKTVTKFYRGAFIPGKPVRPIVLFYHGDWNPCNPDKRRDGDEIIEYSDAEWACQFFGHMYHSLSIKVLPIYTPSAEEKADADLYAQNVQRVIRDEYHAFKEKHRRDRIQKSWKVAAGRESGSLDYEFGDETRALLNTAYSWLGWSETPMESREDDERAISSSKTKRHAQQRKERMVSEDSFVDPFSNN